MFEVPKRIYWWILAGSLVFVVFTVVMGLGHLPYNQEFIFAGSLAIAIYLIVRLTRSLEAEARKVLLGTSIIIFVYRALPGPGEGSSWWMIDVLGFDQQFLSVLSLIGTDGSTLGLHHVNPIAHIDPLWPSFSLNPATLLSAVGNVVSDGEMVSIMNVNADVFISEHIFITVSILPWFSSFLSIVGQSEPDLLSFP
jgi:hypothetical protein